VAENAGALSTPESMRVYNSGQFAVCQFLTIELSISERRALPNTPRSNHWRVSAVPMPRRIPS